MLQDYKISAFEKTHAMLDDNPSATLSSAQLKAWWDSSPEEVRISLNAVIDALIATAAGASGAHQIASETIIGVAGDTVHAQLTSLKAQLNGVTLGQIPAGSLTLASQDPSLQTASIGGLLNAYTTLGGF